MPSSELVNFLNVLLGARIDRVRNERGASAVEWVVITALLIGIAIALAAIIRTKIMDKANSIDLG